LFEREQFLVPPEENIRLSRIANGYEETGDEEQQHVEEEMEEEMEEVLNLAARTSPKIAGCQPVWKKNKQFPSHLSVTRFYNYYSLYPYTVFEG
jgi:Lon protease-like protein